MPDAHKNFAASLIATAPSPAASGTSLVVTSSEGALFPLPPFNATIWPASSQPTAANAEIVRVTNIVGDTFTITRTQESSSARTVIVGDQIAATVTALVMTQAETFQPVITPTELSANTDNWNPTNLATAGTIRVSTDAERNLTGIVAPSADAKMLILANVGSQLLNLVHDQTSTAANRFYIGNNASSGDFLRLTAGSTVLLCYDNTSQRWRAVHYLNPSNAAGAALGTAASGTSLVYAREDHVHPSEGVASTGYTPTLTQSGAVTKTVTYAHYIQIGKLMHVWFELAVTGAGTTANAIRVGLPATAVSGPSYIGSGSITDASVQEYPVLWLQATTSTVEAYRTDTAVDGPLGVSPAFALANTDSISGYLIYEAA